MAKYNWFEPRYISSTIPNPLPAAGQDDVGFLAEVVNNTLWGLGDAAVQSAKGGIGLGWARSVLGGAEWRVPFLDVAIRL